MEELSLIESIKRIALKNVLRPDNAAFIRRIHRWFSKEFSTPLETVETYDLEYLLVHYFESLFEQMEEKDREDYLQEAIETPEERKKRELQENLDDEAFLKQVMEEEAQKEKIDYSKVKEELQSPLKPQLDKLPEIDIKVVDEQDIDWDTEMF